MLCTLDYGIDVGQKVNTAGLVCHNIPIMSKDRPANFIFPLFHCLKLTLNFGALCF